MRHSWLKHCLIACIGISISAVGLTACGGSPPTAPEATATLAPTATLTTPAQSPTPVPTATAQSTAVPAATAAPGTTAAAPESADDVFSAYGNLVLLDGVVRMVAQLAQQVEAGNMTPAAAQDGMAFLQSQLLPGVETMLQAPAPADAMQPAWEAAREMLPTVREAVAQAAAGEMTAAEAATSLESVRARLAEPVADVETYLAEDVGLDRESQRLGREWMLAEVRAALGLPAAPEATATAPASGAAPLTVEDLANATYRGVYEDQAVELSDGQYEGEPFVEGGASRPTVSLAPFHAFGDLNGDGAQDAVAILVESSGGSGSFWYLAAVLDQRGEPENVATLLIGDRVQVKSVSVEGATITVEAVTHAPDDPLCCPTQESTLTYEFRAGELVETTP